MFFQLKSADPPFPQELCNLLKEAFDFFFKKNKENIKICKELIYNLGFNLSLAKSNQYLSIFEVV